MGYVADIGVPTINDVDKAMDIRNQISKTLKSLGGQYESSGAGFGYCDIQIAFDSYKEQAVRRELIQILKPHKIEISNSAEDSEDDSKAYFSFYEDGVKPDQAHLNKYYEDSKREE